MSFEQTPKENTYIIDPESAAEMARLIRLDQFTTQGMGGPLAGLPDLPSSSRILDIACGPGGWALDVAYANLDSEVAGIDISKTMISYANARARSQGLTNVSFGIMDITGPLDFSDNSFDLVNGRLLVGVLLSDRWPELLVECLRVLKPGGIFRWTETESAGLTNSPAFEELSAMMGKAVWTGGYGFSSNGRAPCITHVMGSKLREAGFQNIQYKAHVIEFSAGTPAWADFYANSNVLFKVIPPLLIKTGAATSREEVERLDKQRQIEMLASNFSGIWDYMSAWGTKP